MATALKTAQTALRMATPFGTAKDAVSRPRLRRSLCNTPRLGKRLHERPAAEQRWSVEACQLNLPVLDSLAVAPASKKRQVFGAVGMGRKGW
jgi:hypothetical protein